MGDLKVEKLTGSVKRAKYIQQLLTDIKALEQMLGQDMFENDTVRIGAEQEFCLVNHSWGPSRKAMELLQGLNDPYFTTELALYNLETNLDPLILTGYCFSKMHEQLNALLAKARKEAAKHDLKIILTGILPTIDSRHLQNSYMTPTPRYQLLNSTVRDLRGDNLELHIKGVDEINMHHDSILFEGCNTSFQGHLQIDTKDFANSYNWAQAIAGPLLAICANSPILMGRELWQETRIALFTQSVDTRPSSFFLDEREARVGFGKDWVTGSVADYFKNGIIQFRSMLTADFKADSIIELENGKVPKLRSLNLHNGTVYKWNRVCYGVTDGKPHIRIENRYMPSGPTTTDELANFMFWVGVMQGRPKTFDDINGKMDFKDIKCNFYNAARYGTAAQFYWNGKLIPCKELLLDHFLPMAYKGLYRMKVSPEDVERYLSVIENRINSRNGAQWMVQSYRKLAKDHHKTPDVLRTLTAVMYAQEQKGYSIDAWELARGDEGNSDSYKKMVRDCMSTKTITAQQNDSAELVLKMMQWKNIHHVPIMNTCYDLVGLLTWTDMELHLSTTKIMGKSVKHIMKTNLITTTMDTYLQEAQRLMASHKINCLPVIKGKKLMGILTSNDL